MASVTMPVADLAHMCYNANLYTSKKSAAGPFVKWEIQPHGGVYLTASDDYFIISDFTGGSAYDGPSHHFFLSLESMKVLDKELREKAGDVILDVLDNALHVDGVEMGVFQDADEEAWEHAECILGMRDFVDHDADVFETTPEGRRVIFAVHPDRLRKLSLVKPGDFPIDCRYGWNSRYDRDVIHFKVGPTVRGVFAPLDREILADALKDKGDMLW